MKTIFWIFSFVIAFLPALAQDQLFKRDNSKLEVKVLEITPTEVKYKLFSYQDGPTIVVAKSDVALIIYQNGQHEVFNAAPAQTPVSDPDGSVARKARARMLRDEKLEMNRMRNAELRQRLDSMTTTKNWISVNMLELANGGLSVGYMREFFKNRFDVTAQLGVGFVTPTFSNIHMFDSYNSSGFNFDRKVIEGILGANFHTNNTHPITHFVGPMLGFAQFNGHYTESYSSGSGVYNPVQRHFVMNRYTFYVNNGILFRVTKNLNCAMNMAIGFGNEEFVSAVKPKKSSYQYEDDSTVLTHVKLGFNIGYRF